MEFPIALTPKYQKLVEELDIRPEDIEEHFARGGGPGGQKINKASIAVRLKHIPTGIEVRVQRYREQNANRKSAYHLLFLKIEEEIKGKESILKKREFKIRKQKQRRSRRTKEKMLEEKHKHSEIKELRKNVQLKMENE